MATDTKLEALSTQQENPILLDVFRHASQNDLPVLISILRIVLCSQEGDRETQELIKNYLRKDIAPQLCNSACNRANIPTESGSRWRNVAFL
jgi:hypothetical protein